MARPVVKVVVSKARVRVVTGLRGPSGPAGPAGSPDIALTAGETLSGHRVVVAGLGGVLYAQPSNVAHADAVVGITTGAAISGASVMVRGSGDMTEPSWSWTAGQPLFVIANGQLSHTPPISGWVQMFAVALTATRIKLTDRAAVLLG